MCSPFLLAAASFSRNASQEGHGHRPADRGGLGLAHHPDPVRPPDPGLREDPVPTKKPAFATTAAAATTTTTAAPTI